MSNISAYFHDESNALLKKAHMYFENHPRNINIKRGFCRTFTFRETNSSEVIELYFWVIYFTLILNIIIAC